MSRYPKMRKIAVRLCEEDQKYLDDLFEQHGEGGAARRLAVGPAEVNTFVHAGHGSARAAASMAQAIARHREASAAPGRAGRG